MACGRFTGGDKVDLGKQLDLLRLALIKETLRRGPHIVTPPCSQPDTREERVSVGLLEFYGQTG